MDRIITLKMRKFSIPLSILLALSLQTSLGFGGVVLTTPEKDPPLKPGEKYSESMWGQGPAKVETGFDSGYTHHVMDGSDEALELAEAETGRPPAGASRSLASEKRKSKSSESRETAEGMMEGSPSALARKGVQEVALIAGDLGFFPKTVFLTRDVPVRIFVTGASKNTLCFMMDSFQVRRQIRSQKIEEITFTPHTPGKFRFYCPVNGMEGSMIVRELAS